MRPRSRRLRVLQVIDDEVIARIAHGVEQPALLIVQQAAAAFLGDQRVPPENAVVAGIKCQQRGAAKTDVSRRATNTMANNAADRSADRKGAWPYTELRRASRGEAVVDLALCRAA